jgi:hypothetical protein
MNDGYRENSRRALNLAPLAGARIWLSGAIPEVEGTTESQRAAIIRFVRGFARRVFEHGVLGQRFLIAEMMEKKTPQQGDGKRKNKSIT